MSQVMRILHLVHTPGPGGTEQVVENIVAWLPKESVYQAVAAPNGPLGKAITNQGARFFPLPFAALRRSYDPRIVLPALRAGPSILHDLRRIIRRVSPDIIHAHSAKAAILARLAVGKSRRLLILWHVHDYLPLGAFRQVWKRLAMHSADAMAAVSRDVAHEVFGDHRVTVIHNAVAFPAKEKTYGQSLRHQLGIPPEALVGGYAGRLDEEKGLGILIEALRLLDSFDSSLYLLLAGDSPFHGDSALSFWRNHIRLWGIDHRVRFLGRLSDLDEFYASIDLFILPSPREPFGLVVLEALSRGIPVVACNSGGPAEILRGFQGAVLVPPHDAAGLAIAWRETITNKEIHTAAQELGPPLVRTRYSPMVQANAILSLYKELLP